MRLSLDHKSIPENYKNFKSIQTHFILKERKPQCKWDRSCKLTCIIMSSFAWNRQVSKQNRHTSSFSDLNKHRTIVNKWMSNVSCKNKETSLDKKSLCLEGIWHMTSCDKTMCKSEHENGNEEVRIMSRYYHGITIIKLTFMSCCSFSCAMTLKKGL